MKNNVGEYTEDTRGYPVESEAKPPVFDPIKAVRIEKPVVVSEVDVLRAKVLGLELEKLTLEATLMKQQLSMVTQQLGDRERTRRELLDRADAMQGTFMDKYGIDIRAGKINDDGTFTPAPGQRPPSGS